MNSLKAIGLVSILLFSIISCTPASETLLEEPTTMLPPTASMPARTATIPPPTIETPLTEATSEPVAFPLSVPGRYHAGNQEFTLVDESRDGREITVLLWYPALLETDADGRAIVRNAVPDRQQAPYPLILTEEESGRTIFLSHLATHGFVTGVVKSPPFGLPVSHPGDFIFLDQVLDFRYVLAQIAANPPADLVGVVDTDHVGVTGFSYGGDIAVALGGARIDPEYYLAHCAHIEDAAPFDQVYRDFTCVDADYWDAFTAYAGDEFTAGDDGLWQPLRDARIQAVMPMAPSISWYFGDRGLAAAEIPHLILTGSKDTLAPYQLETVYTYEHLGSPERFLISFIGKNHSMTFGTEVAARIRHFATAFFGTYLQGREEYADYFSPDFVNQFDDLAWGVYQE